MWSQVYTFGLKGFGKLQWTFPWEISSRHGLELLGQNRIHSNLPGLKFSLALNQLQVEGQDSVGRDSYLISNLAKLFLFFRTMPQRSHIQIFSNTQKDFCNRLHGIFFPSFLSLSSQMNLRFIIPVSSGWWIDAEQWEKIHRQLVPGGNLYSLLKLKVNPFSNNNKKKKYFVPSTSYIQESNWCWVPWRIALMWFYPSCALLFMETMSYPELMASVKGKRQGGSGGRGLNRTWRENRLDAGNLLGIPGLPPFPWAHPLARSSITDLACKRGNTMPALSISREDNTCKVNTQIHKILGTVKMDFSRVLLSASIWGIWNKICLDNPTPLQS